MNIFAKLKSRSLYDIEGIYKVGLEILSSEHTASSNSMCAHEFRIFYHMLVLASMKLF
jgi:hypothetical protein